MNNQTAQEIRKSPVKIIVIVVLLLILFIGLTLPRAEIVGTWEGVYYSDVRTGEGQAISKNITKIKVNNDRTFETEIKGEGIFRGHWEYYKTSDTGEKVYRGFDQRGDSIEFYVTDINDTETLVTISDDAIVFYQK